MEGAGLLKAAHAGAIPAWEGQGFTGGVGALCYVAVVSWAKAGGKTTGIGPWPGPAAGKAGVKPGALNPAGERCWVAVPSG